MSITLWEKPSWEGPTCKMFISKKEWASLWEHSKNRKNIVNPSFVNDNKLFWKTVKQLFWNKWSSETNIKPVGKDEVLSTFFKYAVSSLDVNENSSIINENFQNIDDSVDRSIEMYKYH